MGEEKFGTREIGTREKGRRKHSYPGEEGARDAGQLHRPAQLGAVGGGGGRGGEQVGLPPLPVGPLLLLLPQLVPCGEGGGRVLVPPTPPPDHGGRPVLLSAPQARPRVPLLLPRPVPPQASGDLTQPGMEHD